MKRPLFLLLCLTSPGCAEPDPTVPPESLDFPGSFLFGTATAGFQVDMGCPTLPVQECADTASDWYAYVTEEELVAQPKYYLAGEDPAVSGPGHWELFADDYDLARDELQNNAFRLSLEWSRIFPTSTVGIEGYDALREVADPAALDTYHAMFRALEARGLTPVVTLHHYTMPTWLHDGVGCTMDFDSCSRRGWIDQEKAVRELTKYAGFVAREFGGEVDLWATQNEPFAVIISAYVFPSEERTNPPALLMEAEAARTAYVAMVEAHARSYDAIAEADRADADGDGSPAEIGLVYALSPVRPAVAGDPLDARAAEHAFYLWNTAFLDAVALGNLDRELDGTAVHREDLAGRLDWLGINYKTSIVVSGTEEPVFPELSPLLDINPFALDFSVVEPAGLLEILSWAGERYGLPMYVTENNGQAVPRGDMDAEIDAVVQNLSWIAVALDRGLDVRGYFYWSLMDNYEWNQGMRGKPLGLYRVDPDDPTKAREPRSIAEVYGEIAGAGRIPAELARAHPIALE